MMKIGFAGTPAFAAIILEHLINCGKYQIEFVLTQPDRPSGRGMNMSTSKVGEVALQHNLKIYQPTSLKLNEQNAQYELAQDVHNLMQHIDVLIVAAYGLILPASLVENYICLNVHASLLPRWRGAAPIHRAIQAQDKNTGISIMHMDKGLDTGDILYMQDMQINATDTTTTIHDALAKLGAQSLEHTLQNFNALFAQKIKQSTFNAESITYAHKITKQDVILDLSAQPHIIQAHLNAFNAVPMTKIGNCKIWQAQAETLPQKLDNTNNGTIIKLDASIDIICNNGAGVLKIHHLQMPNKRSMNASDFLLGHKLELGKNILDYMQ
jgi:methionyl-tRNA formyltransferase